jgi:hypothetical protein
MSVRVNVLSARNLTYCVLCAICICIAAWPSFAAEAFTWLPNAKCETVELGEDTNCVAWGDFECVAPGGPCDPTYSPEEPGEFSAYCSREYFPLPQCVANATYECKHCYNDGAGQACEVCLESLAYIDHCFASAEDCQAYERKKCQIDYYMVKCRGSRLPPGP